MQLPKEFEQHTRKLMGEALYARLASGLSGKPVVSIRRNPYKTNKIVLSDDVSLLKRMRTTEVPWCKDGLYLAERPNFTSDPLLHAGAYYVQDASSMFIDFVLRQIVAKPVTMLDLCAAPGGKTTCARAALPEGSVIYSNEPVRTRANVLAENVIKFGHPDVIVTNNYASDFAKAGLLFDVILTDVPCSGEGMFRKDANAIADWSPGKVSSCQQMQRSILEDIWPCLKPGGILIYSTCTFNALENEENVQWIVDELKAEPIALENVRKEWLITGAMKGNLPVYRFLPGLTRGEGLFLAVVKKNENGSCLKEKNDERKLRILTHGVKEPIVKGKKTIPDISLALSIDQTANTYPRVDVGYSTAINYLRHEAITLPDDTPHGIVTITYGGLALGFANNIGNRANNLYPQEWRIRSTHIIK